jgi:NAD(P)-dependent dehydrogenase (short-subunit alcohol dehydrogenase family)
MSQNLAHKTAIVTGASRGIGRAIALKLAEEGAAVRHHHDFDVPPAYRQLTASVLFYALHPGKDPAALNGDLAGCLDAELADGAQWQSVLLTRGRLS